MLTAGWIQERTCEMYGDLRLEPETEEEWFPNGIEIVPRPPLVVVIAVLLVACVAAIAAGFRLLRVH